MLRFQLLSGCHVGLDPYDPDESAASVGTYLRLYGRTAEGGSVGLTVYGFRPYLYARLPEAAGDEHGRRVWRDAVLRRLAAGGGGVRPVRGVAAEHVLRRRLDGFSEGQLFPFLRLRCPTQAGVRRCAQLLRQPLQGRAGHPPQGLAVYEANVAPLTRYLVDRRLAASGWAEVPLASLSGVACPRTRCEHELVLRDPAALEPVPGESSIAPLLIASFDIECSSTEGGFPNPAREGDRCIQVATTLQRYGSQPHLKHLVALRACNPIEGVEVQVVATEGELLLAWQRFVREQNPDVLVGYNILKFDLSFMWERARLLGVATAFSQLGRDRYDETRFVTKTMSSNAAGSNEYRLFDSTLCRVQLDLLPIMRQGHKLESYSLNAVSEALLGDKKVDMTPGRLFQLWEEGTPEGLTQIGVYCVKDVELPLRLMAHLKTVPNLVEMSRITQVTIDDLVVRGQQIKVFNQLLKFCGPRDMLIPTLPDREEGADEEAEKAAAEKFQGATVIEPKVGVYIDAEMQLTGGGEGVRSGCVTVLDFKSLYPTIMRGFNLCYSTLSFEGGPHDAAPGVEWTEYAANAQGRRYRFALNRPGVLPAILGELSAARTEAKRQMKAATDPGERAVLDGRQLALKVSANSIYGFTGVTRGFLPQREIAESVTRNGRRMIEETKAFVELHYKGSEVIYGDTDSVMVLFGHPGGRPASMPECFAMGEAAAAAVTRTFPPPVELEFEKVYRTYMLFKKKRYIGLKFEDLRDPDGEIDAKGVQIVRRDNMPYVRAGLLRVSELILRQGDVEAAKAHVCTLIADLLGGRVPTAELLLSKALSGSYKKREGHSPPAHVAVAQKRAARDPNDRVLSGERVPFVYVQLPGRTERDLKKTKQAERAECPAHAEARGLRLDYLFYFQAQLQKPINSMLQLLMPRPSQAYADTLRSSLNALRGQREITSFFKRREPGAGAPAVPAELLCDQGEESGEESEESEGA